VKAVESEAGRLLERGVERTKPLWKFYLLVPEFAGRSQDDTALSSHPIDGALLLVGHHSFADGLAGMELVSALSDGGVIARGKIPAEQRVRVDTPKTLTGSRHTTFRAVKEIFTRKLHGAFHGENSSSRKMYTFTMPLDRLEAISKEQGVSVNDVYLASIARAAHFYEARRHSESGEHRVIVPVSVRPISARRAMGNYLTGVAIRLPSGKLETSALLTEINVETKRLKETGAIATYSRIAELTGRMPPRLAKTVCKFLASKTSFICTNIPDSPKHRYIGGAKICAYFPCPAPLHNQGVAFGLVTYAQTACFSYVVDPAIIDGPLELREDIERAVESLKQ
jgi:diacylglycerol O-acyltransferase / wax synthase